MLNEGIQGRVLVQAGGIDIQPVLLIDIAYPGDAGDGVEADVDEGGVVRHLLRRDAELGGQGLFQPVADAAVLAERTRRR